MPRRTPIQKQEISTSHKEKADKSDHFLEIEIPRLFRSRGGGVGIIGVLFCFIIYMAVVSLPVLRLLLAP